MFWGRGGGYEVDGIDYLVEEEVEDDARTWWLCCCFCLPFCLNQSTRERERDFSEWFFTPIYTRN